MSYNPAIGTATPSNTPGSVVQRDGSGDIAVTGISVSTIDSTATQTPLTGSAGTATCSQPFQGASYKKVIVYLSGFTDDNTQIYTFPTAFTEAPYIYGLTAGVSGATVTLATVKFNVTAETGFVIIEGY
jgi:hypothetical protein